MMRVQTSTARVATEPGSAVSTRSRRAVTRQVAQGLAVAILALACYYVISTFLVQSVTVVGMSMSPTLQDSDQYLLNRWIYYVRDPEPTDVVVIEDPADHGFSVKRVVAGAGDTVYISDGMVYVNGRKLTEPYLPAGMPTYPCTQLKEQLFKCGQDQFFVLGDNRLNSADSRVYGPVPRKYILGQIIR